MIYSDILRHVKTVDQARGLSSEIDVLLDSLFKTDNKAFEKALNSISAIDAEVLKSAFGGLKNNISPNNLSTIKEYLTQLKEEIQKLKILKLSLAFDPSEDTIGNLFTWVWENLGERHILDIQKDQTILGGAIIEFEGKYKDLSLKKKLDEVFATKREEITEIIA